MCTCSRAVSGERFLHVHHLVLQLLYLLEGFLFETALLVQLALHLHSGNYECMFGLKKMCKHTNVISKNSSLIETPRRFDLIRGYVEK